MYVYFAVARELGMVKIGYCKNVKNRFRYLDQACPVPLIVPIVLKGGKKKEKELHEQFKDYLSHREWFFVKGELQKFIHFTMRKFDRIIAKGEKVCDCNFCTFCSLQGSKVYQREVREKFKKEAMNL